MPPPIISVIVPTFNREQLLPRALDSILHQTCTNWEIVLVDDGSTDRTSEIIRAYQEKLGDRLIAIRQINQGCSAARNRGIEAARGHFVAFLDSDDEFMPEKLERQLALFDRCPKLGLVYSDYVFIDLDGTKYDRAIAAKMPIGLTVEKEEIEPGLFVCKGSIFDTLIRGYFIATIVGMVRREVLGKSIRFSPKLSYAEEWLFFLEVARTCRTGYVDEALCVHHATRGSLARTDTVSNFVRQREVLQAVLRTFSDLPSQDRRSLRLRCAATCRQLGVEALRRNDRRAAMREFLTGLRFGDARQAWDWLTCIMGIATTPTNNHNERIATQNTP
ncbi:MAG: glycosyltransferase family 2 protein [Planctomycetota bacterium]